MKNVWMVFCVGVKVKEQSKFSLALSVGGTKIHKIHFRLEQKIYWPYVNVVFFLTEPTVSDQESPDLNNRLDLCPHCRHDIESNSGKTF